MTTAPPARALVAIDGIDGSGKSTLADRLIEALAKGGVAVVRLRVDDFRRPVDWARTDRPELDLYYDEYYDLQSLDACLRGFLDGAAALEIVVHDLAAGMAAPRAVTVGTATIALLEGVFVRRVPAVATAAVIDVQTSRDEARRRILARDTARGRTPDDVTHRIDARYFPAQDLYRAGLAGSVPADAIIDNEDPAAARLLRLDEARVPPAVARALRRLFPVA